MACLLDVQTWDLKLHQHCTRLAAFPQQIANLEEKIAKEQNALQQWHQRHRQLQSHQQELEFKIQTAEDKVEQYQNQQRSIQKDDAYQALAREIATLQEQITTWEDEGIALLLDIDKSKADGEAKRIQTQTHLDELQAQINRLKEQKNTEQQHTATLEQQLQQACSHVNTAILDAYQKVKVNVKRPPYIVPLDKQQCTGCHLRMSRDIIEQVIAHKDLTCCDQCGRIIYHLTA